MPVDSKIVDPASGRGAAVDEHSALLVAQSTPDIPADGVENRYTLYNALLGSAGAVESGIVNANMGVNGAVTEQEFYIGAEADADIRIMRIVVIIADSAVAHSAFGNVSALTNGFGLDMFERGISTPILDSAKTGGQMIAQSGIYGAYGSGATSFELTNWTGTADAQTVVFDMAAIVPGGVRIARNTEDKIFATVRDDLTGLTEFTVRAMGYRHHE